MEPQTNKSLKILLTDPHIKGGGQITYICRLAQGLTRHGHKVYVACRKNSIFVEYSNTFSYVPISIFNFKGGLRPLSWLKDIHTFKKMIMDISPDIIHANGSQDHWTSAIANELLSHRFCLVRTRHNTYPLKNHYFNRWLNLKCTDYHISVCEMVRQNLIKHNNFPENRICSIHNGVDTTEFQHNEAMREKARKEFGLTDNDIVCGISARLSPAKGHVFLLQAIKTIASECPEVKVLILGSGALEEELKIQSNKLGIAHKVIFAGYRKDMAYCTQAFDIAVLPSIDCDTSSFSLKEAMAEGKPVIASDYGGLPEIITDGVEGVIVPAGTIEPLAKAIKELAKNPELRKSMGENAKKRAVSMFSLEQFVNRTISAYHKALEFFHARTTH